jgi:hypothetical protein
MGRLHNQQRWLPARFRTCHIVRITSLRCFSLAFQRDSRECGHVRGVALKSRETPGLGPIVEIKIIFKVPNTPGTMPSIVKSLQQLADDLASWNPPTQLRNEKGEIIGEVIIGSEEN